MGAMMQLKVYSLAFIFELCFSFIKRRMILASWSSALGLDSMRIGGTGVGVSVVFFNQYSFASDIAENCTSGTPDLLACE